MGWAEDLLTGLAEYLDAQGVGVWDPDGTTSTIILGSLPAELDTGVGLHGWRAGADDPQHPTTRVIVQLYSRAPERAALDALDEAGYNAVHGLAGVTFGTCHLTQALSKSSAPMGIDESGRWERASNYACDLDLTATALRTY